METIEPKKYARLRVFSWAGSVENACHVYAKIEGVFYDPNEREVYRTKMKGAWADRITAWVRGMLRDRFSADAGWTVHGKDAEVIDGTWSLDPVTLTLYDPNLTGGK